MKGYIGYRYSKVRNEIYITKLRCFNEYANPLYREMPIDFFTTDCIVEEIKNANTGNRVKFIEGAAWFPFRYEEGQRITGTSIYYCKTRTALFMGYLCRDFAGRVTDRLSDLLHLYDGFYSGLSFIALSIIKSADDEETLYEELNRFFLRAEKQHFKDENRGIDEILHKDPLTWENVPPELKLDGLTQAETEAAWIDFRQQAKAELAAALERNPARQLASNKV